MGVTDEYNPFEMDEITDESVEEDSPEKKRADLLTTLSRANKHLGRDPARASGAVYEVPDSTLIRSWAKFDIKSVADAQSLRFWACKGCPHAGFLIRDIFNWNFANPKAWRENGFFFIISQQQEIMREIKPWGF
jgi:hypothetical protein